MLFNSIDQISAIVKVASSPALKIATITPSINQAETKYLQPLFDSVTWFKLQNGFPSYSADPYLLPLLPLAQAASANFGIFLSLDMIAVNISDAGITRSETTASPSAYKYQVDNLKEALNTAGNDAIDAMLAYMEANIESFTDWATSDEYKRGKQYFINCATDFSRAYNIRNSRRVFLQILPSMDLAEEFYIQQSIGYLYFDELKEKVLDNDLNADDKFILKMIKKAVANYTMFEAFNTLNFQITDHGLILNTYKAIRDSNDETVVASMQQVAVAREQAKRSGDGYIKKALDYLNANASAIKYPTYFADSSVYVPPSKGDISVFDNKPNHKIYFAG